MDRLPRGVHPFTYASICPPIDSRTPSAEHCVEKIGKSIVGIRNRQYSVEQVFENVKDDDIIFGNIFDAESSTSSEFKPLDSFVFDNVNLCVISLGSSTSRKKELYEGGTGNVYLSS